MAQVEVCDIRVDLPLMPDFTPANGPECYAAFPSGLTCTRSPHTDPVHVAGDSNRIVGIWVDHEAVES